MQVASTGISGRTPSSIRTADPSCIARNKIAELELRLELERVVRLDPKPTPKPKPKPKPNP